MLLYNQPCFEGNNLLSSLFLNEKRKKETQEKRSTLPEFILYVIVAWQRIKISEFQLCNFEIFSIVPSPVAKQPLLHHFTNWCIQGIPSFPEAPQAHNAIRE